MSRPNIHSRSSTSSGSLEPRGEEVLSRKLIHVLIAKVKALVLENQGLLDKLTVTESRCSRLEERTSELGYNSANNECKEFVELLSQKDALLALRDSEIMKLREEVSRLRLPLPSATARYSSKLTVPVARQRVRSVSKAPPEIVANSSSPKGSAAATSRAKLRQSVFPIRSVPRR